MSVIQQDVGISLLIKDLNPNSINPDFLKYGDIVPESWELARPPVYSNRVTQIAYKSGLQLVVQANRIDFFETKNLQDPQEPQIGTLVARFIEKLSKVEYQDINVFSRSYVKFPTQADSHDFLTKGILKEGAWSQNSSGDLQAAIQLGYPLKDGRLNLSINEAVLSRPDAEEEYVILFSGSYTPTFEESSEGSRLENINNVVNNWSYFTNLISEKVHQFPIPTRSTEDKQDSA